MENKTGKYFKYAIGEIVLVVIGILIALQVNDWNEGRKLIKEEASTLEKLHQESEDIVAYLNTMYKTYKNYIYAIEKSADALHHKELNGMTEDEVAFGIFSTGYYEAISPPKSVFEELNGTGKIKNIRSNEVRKLIGDYYAYLEYLNTQLVYFRNQFTKPVDEAGEDMIYIYDENNPMKIRALINFNNLCDKDMFISKHTKALRDQIAFNQDRKILLNHAVDMCQELSNALKTNCTILN